MNFVKRGKSESQMMRDFVADGGSLIGLVQKHTEIWAAG
jgi:carboxylate-amine ligase